MTDSVIPLRFNVQQVGKHVKSSKKRFTWEVSLNSRQHIIVLDFSFISGKVKVAVDRKVLLQNQLPANTSFQYPFTLDGNSLNVIQQGESFELRINNKVFSHLYNQMKTNKQFKKYEDQIKDFKVNQNQFKAQKITLNIGGIGGGMKKKPKNQSAQGHTWNAFGEDEMSGFPNYFQGQSVSTTVSQKVEQKPQVAQRKVSNDLLGDVSVSGTQKQEKPQNILDFEAEIQKSPLSTVNPKTKDEFSTMQLMFQTMNVNQGGKQSVTVDNNEVDFFNNSSVESSNTSTLNQSSNIDFFADMNTPSSVVTSTPIVASTQPTTGDYNTMRYMFATNAPNIGSNINQFAFNTSVNQNKPSSGLDLNWNPTSLQNKQPENVNINLNTTTGPVINQSNFSTLQGLFATNAIGAVNQPTNFNTQTGIQQPVINNQQAVNQTNFNLNTQHFATQQIPTQAFGTSFNVNPQSFGTQSFMGQNVASQQISFLGQQSTTQPVTQPQQSYVQQPVAVPQQSTEINPNDFSSMQFLFKTNVPTQQNVQTPVIQQTSTTPSQSFTQQFATTSGSVQSPNMMYMNTYGGSNSANLSFDLGVNPQQFTTSVNPSMMKKKAPQSNTSVSPADLL